MSSILSSPGESQLFLCFKMLKYMKGSGLNLLLLSFFHATLFTVSDPNILSSDKSVH